MGEGSTYTRGRFIHGKILYRIINTRKFWAFFSLTRLGLAQLPAKTAGAVYALLCLSGSHFGFLCMNKTNECFIERQSSGGALEEVSLAEKNHN